MGGEEVSLGELIGAVTGPGELIGAVTGPGEWMIGSLGELFAKAGQQRRDLRAGE
ncbi:hypothetical protein [Nocardia asiatica]|uniref:hypothetical protein n=1 Tax=Nocardia asiatica TaxID=209252 RepID=UPI003EE3BB25